MAVSLVLVVVLLAVGYTLVQDAVAWVGGALPSWLGWLASGLAPLLYIIGILVAGWLFGFLAVIVASPFLGVLSAATEQQQYGDKPDFEESVGLALVHALLREGRKLAYHVPRLLGVFVLSLLPIINLVAPALWFAFGSWMLAVQFVDYAAENRGLEFRDTLALLRANRGAALGFGALAALLLAVPFAALLVIPRGRVRRGAALETVDRDGRTIALSPFVQWGTVRQRRRCVASSTCGSTSWPRCRQGVAHPLPTAPRLVGDRRRGQSVDNPANAVPLVKLAERGIRLRVAEEAGLRCGLTTGPSPWTSAARFGGEPAVPRASERGDKNMALFIRPPSHLGAPATSRRRGAERLSSGGADRREHRPFHFLPRKRFFNNTVDLYSSSAYSYNHQQQPLR